ncbi:hypothetical protein A3K64_01170 [Candidatus Micrarchaeota archaeon RBG_16_36_9]|nr:MAG: hypothetical protein A3K64_01170 [Candidatus Micrarchaeota archaeon RBG_16_36_9]
MPFIITYSMVLHNKVYGVDSFEESSLLVKIANVRAASPLIIKTAIIIETITRAMTMMNRVLITIPL